MARPTNRDRDEISDAVIELRTRLGDTQQQFAQRLGIALTSVARYETSRRPKGAALLTLQRIAKEAGQPQIATIFGRALSAEMDWASEGPLLTWANFVREIVRNKHICPGWQKIADLLIKEMENLIERAHAGQVIKGNFPEPESNIRNLESWLIEARYSMEGSAERLIEQLTLERQAQHPEETKEAAYAATLVEHPELYLRYKQERATAARGTQFAASLATYGTLSQAHKPKKRTKKRPYAKGTVRRNR